MPLLDRPGRFQADITNWGIQPNDKTPTVAVVLDFAILAQWNDTTKSWDDWTQFGQVIRGFFYIIKKNGELNDRQVESLIKSLGWNGNMEDFAAGSEWKPKPCQIVVDYETYQNKSKLKVQWINPFDGPDMKKASDGEVKKLAAQHGSKLRALAGNITRNAPAPPPAAPRQGPPPPIPQETNQAAEVPANQVPW